MRRLKPPQNEELPVYFNLRYAPQLLNAASLFSVEPDQIRVIKAERIQC